MKDCFNDSLAYHLPQSPRPVGANIQYQLKYFIRESVGVEWNHNCWCLLSGIIRMVAGGQENSHQSGDAAAGDRRVSRQSWVYAARVKSYRG